MSVSIRRATSADAPALHALRSEASARRYQPLQQVSLEALTKTLTQRASALLNATLQHKVQFVIEAEGQPAGWVTLDVTSREHGVGSIGYTVGEAFRGKGIATTAVRQVTDLAFDPNGVDLQRLEAVAAVQNSASRRVLIKAGFREEGIARGLLVIDGVRVDHVRFGLLRSDRNL